MLHKIRHFWHLRYRQNICTQVTSAKFVFFLSESFVYRSFTRNTQPNKFYCKSWSMSQGGCFKFKSGCSRPSEEIFRDLAEILTWNSESIVRVLMFTQKSKRGQEKHLKIHHRITTSILPWWKSVPSGQTDSVVMSAETSPDGVRRATSCQRYQNHETSVTWSFFGTWVGPVGAFCDIHIYIYIYMYIYTTYIYTIYIYTIYIYYIYTIYIYYIYSIWI